MKKQASHRCWRWCRRHHHHHHQPSFRQWRRTSVCERLMKMTFAPPLERKYEGWILSWGVMSYIHDIDWELKYSFLARLYCLKLTIIWNQHVTELWLEQLLMVCFERDYEQEATLWVRFTGVQVSQLHTNCRIHNFSACLSSCLQLQNTWNCCNAAKICYI